MRKKAKKNVFPFAKFHTYLYWFLGISVILLGIVWFQVNKQDLACANSISCISDISGELRPEEKTGEYMGDLVQVPDENFDESLNLSVLGDSNTTNKHIYIDLTNQKLYAKENDNIVYEFLISSGKWGRTPIGDFEIWIKLRSTRMSGGSKEKGTYYNLPNVPYTMFFYNKDIPKSRGYGIHGAYWHNNFGYPMSHGCINLKIEEAKLLYEWADPPPVKNVTYVDKENPGTPITIYGQAPWN